MTTTIETNTEAYRIYHYASGATFRIEAPLRVHVITDAVGATHRVEAADGQTYRPERGWVAISWEPRPEAPSFVA